MKSTTLGWHSRLNVLLHPSMKNIRIKWWPKFVAEAWEPYYCQLRWCKDRRIIFEYLFCDKLKGMVTEKRWLLSTLDSLKSCELNSFEGAHCSSLFQINDRVFFLSLVFTSKVLSAHINNINVVHLATTEVGNLLGVACPGWKSLV